MLQNQLNAITVACEIAIENILKMPTVPSFSVFVTSASAGRVKGHRHEHRMATLKGLFESTLLALSYA